MLKIKQTALAASAVRKDQYPDPLPSVVLFGRSNAGKSSLINTLINRKNLARTSNTPGKTRLLNFYRVDGAVDDMPRSWYFVDLPGYGYAKVSKSERESWLKMMGAYLESEAAKLCWQLVDIRHEPSEQDIAMHQALLDRGFEVQVIANKVDKVGRNARMASLRMISETMQIPRDEILVFSAMSREGREALLVQVEAFLR